MEAQGWIVKQLGAPAAASVPKESVPAKPPPSEVQAAPAVPNVPKASVPAEHPSPEVQSAPAPPNVPKGSAPAESVPLEVQPAPAAGNLAPPPQPSDTPSAQPPIVVKDWFKFGGSADDLAAAQQRCATKLGIDRPDPESGIVSSEMVDCLRNEGWHAF